MPIAPSLDFSRTKWSTDPAAVYPFQLQRPVPAIGAKWKDDASGADIMAVCSAMGYDYSNPSALNSDGSLIAVSDLAVNPSDKYLDTNSGALVAAQLYKSMHNWPLWDAQASQSSGWWDPIDPKLRYSALSGQTPMMVRCRIGEKSVKLCNLRPGYKTGMTGDITADWRIAYWCWDGVVVLDLLTGKESAFAPWSVFQANTPSYDHGSADWLLVTDIDEEVGERYLVTLPNGLVYVVDESAHEIRFKYGPPEQMYASGFKGNRDGWWSPGESSVGGYMDHSAQCRVRLENGKYVVFVMADSVELEGIYSPIPGGQYRKTQYLFRLSAGPDPAEFWAKAIPLWPWPSGHPCAAKTAPVFSAWVEGMKVPFDLTGWTGQIDPTDGSILVPPANAVPLRGEIVTYRVNPDLSISATRLAQHQIANDESRPGISGDGTVVCARTNFGRKPKASNIIVKGASVMPTFVWSLKSGALPSGIALDPAGSLSGTPTAAGQYAFVLGAQGAIRMNDGTTVTGEGTGNYAWTVTNAPPVPIEKIVVAAGTLPDAGVGTPVSVVLSASIQPV